MTQVMDTPLQPLHARLGARFTAFAGWNMPLQYGSLLDEHRAVRERAGLFDLSHMGTLWVDGADAAALLDHALVSQPSALIPGRAHYTMCCDASGGILDDLIVYRTGTTRFLVVPNASNTVTVLAHLARHLAGRDASVEDASKTTALVALQGPRAAAVMARVSDVDLAALRYYGIVAATVAGQAAHVARTGYTGEDGFEVWVEWAVGAPLYEALLAAGAEEGVVPCGLGCRDTLRLEAGMALYGHELDRTVTPFDVGLARTVRFGKPHDFDGRRALEQAARTPEYQLSGLVLEGRNIARQGYAVRHASGEEIGLVTSGTLSPTLGHPVALVRLRAGTAAPGDTVQVDIRGAAHPARLVTPPFYRRGA